MASAQQVRTDGGTPETTYYVYDAGGQRVRKVTERSAKKEETPTRMKERIYLGGFEIYREYDGKGEKVVSERETLHGMDDQQRITLIETKTFEDKDGESLAAQKPLIRYQLGNHLGSAAVEVDSGGKVISYEEYYPYGNTAYQAVVNSVEVSLKRYRYTGKERDQESGLYYYGARYYAAWLGRWVSCDPIGITKTSNLYLYVENNPVRFDDPEGKDSFDCINPDDSEPSSRLGGFGLTIRLDGIRPDSIEVGTLGSDGVKLLDSRSENNEIELKTQIGKPGSSGASNPEGVTEYPQNITKKKEEEESVGEPGFWESLIPIWGSGRESLNHFQKGNYVRGTLWGLLAVTDVFLVRKILTGAGKLASKFIFKESSNQLITKELKKIAIEETMQSISHSSTIAAREAALSSHAWRSLGGYPNIEILEYGEWFIKRVNPKSGKFMTWWGRSSLEAQYHALQSLGNLATPHFMAEGMMFTQNVGSAMSTTGVLSRQFWKSYFSGTFRMGTLFNDIRPRNMGLNGVIFDPAWDSLTKGIFQWGSSYTIRLPFEFQYHYGFTR
jgi:RHS repeat-associated protein